MNEIVKNKVTIADVAKMAGVSASSVSNVLNERSARMRESTKERIVDAIRELGYTPNLAARQLKTGHSRLIGLIVPSVANPFYGNFARYVEEAALEHGYQVMLGNSSRDPIREKKYVEQLWGAGAEGIIFGTSLEKFDHLKGVMERGMNFVSFDRPPLESDSISFDSICVDNRQIMRLTIKHLAALGHKKIGFITGPIQTVSRRFRLEGFRLSLEECGLEFDRRLICEGIAKNFGDVAALELGRQGAHYLFSMPNSPTAVCTINDMYAFGIYAGARDLGLKIPGDVSVVGVDNLTLTEVVEPPLTTVEQPLKEMAKVAVERLLSRLQDAVSEPVIHQSFLPNLIVRGSTSLCRC